MKKISVKGGELSGTHGRRSSFFVLLGVSVISSLFLGGCGKKFYLFNWSYYTPPSVIEKFEKEFNVKVVYDEFDSNEMMYAKLQTGSARYDIVIPSGDYVSIMKSDMLEPIDKSLIPNLANLDPLVLQNASYDPNMEYSVPYYWGASGIILNKAKVPDYEESWSVFAREDLKDRMTMLDDMREVMGDALRFLGFSVNTKNQAEITAARDLINNVWKPNLTKFDADAYGKSYANGEFWVVQGYSEVVFSEIAEDEELMRDTVFFIPPEGGPAYIDNMCILKGSRNKELAHQFINFIHRPEIYAEFCDYFGFPSTTNIPARNFKKGPAWYTAEDLTRTELKEDVGEALEMYNEAWFDSIRVGD